MSLAAGRMLSDMWTHGLAGWYIRHGRHELPWRSTKDPWAVLVSEVMLQQTQTGRVVGRWQEFLRRWPTPTTCAAAPLPELLRFWQGLGYPRRARDLWRAGAAIDGDGWPATEAGLRTLPGVGAYTARALLTFAFEAPSPPPLDVNVSRVAARAALGSEPGELRRVDVEAAVTAGRPRELDRRHYTFALFDVGALHCRAVPICARCPLARGCRWRARGAAAERRPARRQQYEGTMRELRGAILADQLSEHPATTVGELKLRVAACSLAQLPGAVAVALDSLRADGLLDRALMRPAATR